MKDGKRKTKEARGKMLMKIKEKRKKNKEIQK
jgi:hypothetical protein